MLFVETEIALQNPFGPLDDLSGLKLFRERGIGFFQSSEFQLGGVEIFVSLNADGAIAASEVEEIGARPIWKLLVVSRLCGFAKRGKLRMEEFRGEGAGEGFDGFALLRCEVGQFGLSSG